MSRSTLLLLARPRSAADRRRWALVAATVTAAATLLLVAVRIARLRGDGGSGDLARYVTESGLRPGVVLAAVLLCVPVLALLLQALRLGSLARDRRMAALRLAGATPRAVRAVAGVEVAGASAAGALLAGPAYLLLGAALRALPSTSAHLVPAPTWADLVIWPIVVVLLAGVGALSGAAVEGRAVHGPLGMERRARQRAPGLRSLLALIAAVVAAGVGVFVLGDAAGLVALAVAGLVVTFVGGPWLVRGTSFLLLRRDGVRSLLAGSRLAADLRGPGRVAGVLLLCGVAIGIDLSLAGEVLSDDGPTGYVGDDGFYLAGSALAAVAILVAATVAIVTLVVGAAEGLHESRRPMAGIAALGADERLLAGVLRLQLVATAVPPVVLGVALAGTLPLLTGSGEDGGPSGGYLALVAAATVLAGVWMLATAALVTRSMRGRVRHAIEPGNLRAP